MNYAPLLARLHEEQKRVAFSAESHRYRVDGKACPNVTTILRVMDKPQLDQWKVRTQVAGTARAAYENPPRDGEALDAWTQRLSAIAEQQYEHERLSKEAADDGTQVHAMIEHRIRKMLGQDTPRPQISEAAAFREAGWERWARDAKLTPIMVEGRVANRDLGYVGTFDLLAVVGGKLGIWDWKKSKGIWPEHHLQSMAYRMALESIGFPRMEGYALLMPEGQEPRPERLSDSEDTREAFLSCLKLYRWRPDKA